MKAGRGEGYLETESRMSEEKRNAERKRNLVILI